MSNEQKDPKPEEKNDPISEWLVVGAGVGITLGIVFDNLAMGIGMGAALGLVLGAAISLKNKK